MNSYSGFMDSQLILLIGAIAVTILVSKLALQLFSKESKTLLALVVVVLVMQFIFGISPKQLWFEITHLPQAIARLAQQFS